MVMEYHVHVRSCSCTVMFMYGHVHGRSCSWTVMDGHGRYGHGQGVKLEVIVKVMVIAMIIEKIRA